MENKTYVTSLKCEYMINPTGIDIRIPRLSWEIVSSKRSTCQSAYQVVVAINSEGADNLIWDTGKVESNESIDCLYTGSPLESRNRYYWKVRIWDEKDNITPWSDVAYWEMGLMNPEDWKAKWIEPNQRPAQKETRISFADLESGNRQDLSTNYELLNPCQMLRKEFTTQGNIKNARVYATAHGIYSLELNGQRIGDIEFAPEITSYEKYLQYHLYDVTQLLNPGSNVIGATLADGWYAGRIGMTGDSCTYGDKLALLLQLEVEYEDGRVQTVISDDGFKSSTGPFVYSDLFIGEKYDARMEKEGWSNKGYDDSDWITADIADFPYSNLVAPYGEPVRRVREIEPSDIITTPEGETVIDLGQNIAGRMRMRVNGPAGTEVVLEHSEVLDEKGNFIMNIDGRNKDQKDVYILKGAEDEVYEPRFTFHGFRYVRVSGYPGEVRTEDFTGIVISSDLRETGYFECSDQRINQLQSNIVWSQRGNMLSIPTDCPQRERAGWTGDIQVFAPTACFNMDVNTFLTRWMRNLKTDQLDDGQVPIIVPYLKSYHELHHGSFNSDSSAGWGDAAIIVPWVLYNKYGDIRVLEENYGTMVKWVEYIKTSAEEGMPDSLEGELTAERKERQKYLWNTGFHFGDWLTPSVSVNLETGEVDVMKSAFETKELVPTCFYAYSTALLAEIAGILGKAEDRDYYVKLNEKVREAFAREFLNEDGRLKQHLQGIYVLALQFNMIPDNMRDKMLGQLVDLIEKNNNKLDTGFLSVPFIMDVLCKNGRKDIAYRLLFQTECPSWLYEIENGATTIWEAWQAIMPDGKVTNVSYNHYAFGCIGDWMYRHVAGLDMDQPGYRHILIKPDPNEKMSYARAEYHSVYGKIATGWERFENKIRFNVSIPPNTSASVWLPNAVLEEVTEGGGSIREKNDVSLKKQMEDKVILEIGSGEYVFEYPLPDYSR